MNNTEFMLEVESSHNRSKKTLLKKEKEYSDGTDRLIQFHKAGFLQDVAPTESLIGMATKHFTSIVDMSKDPLSYPIKKWDEKIGDLRNYTYLLDALVRELYEESL